MRVTIAGAGAVGRSIARELIDNGHQVLLIDKSPNAIRPERVPDAEWLLADSCELSSLEEAQLDKCDVVIAATGDDKANLVTSLLAKTEFGVPRTVGRVNHPNNEWLFTEAWGVDVNVSTPRIMSALVEEAVIDRRPRAPLHVPPGQRQPGRADAAHGLAVRRHPERPRAVPRQLRARHDPARRAGLHPRAASSRSRPATSCSSSSRPTSRKGSSDCSPPAPTAADRASGGSQASARQARLDRRVVAREHPHHRRRARRSGAASPARSSARPGSPRRCRGPSSRSCRRARSAPARATRSRHGSTSSQVSRVQSFTTCLSWCQAVGSPVTLPTMKPTIGQPMRQVRASTHGVAASCRGSRAGSRPAPAPARCRRWPRQHGARRASRCRCRPAR